MKNALSTHVLVHLHCISAANLSPCMDKGGARRMRMILLVLIRVFSVVHMDSDPSTTRADVWAGLKVHIGVKPEPILNMQWARGAVSPGVRSLAGSPSRQIACPRKGDNVLYASRLTSDL